MSALTLRFAALPADDPASSLRLVAGTMLDYAALAQHHYRAAKPATATRVFTLRHDAPTVVGRWLARKDESRVAAVLVESMPTLSCALRDHALDRRYTRGLTQREAARLLNDEVRCLSRVVVDPRWRSLGLAVRLVRHALDTHATPVTEALAAMGAVCPFFERAGMTRYDRPHHPRDARLLDALDAANIPAPELVSTARVTRRLAQLEPPTRDWLLGELRRWAGPAATDDPHRLALARRRLLCRPVYFVCVHEGNVECTNGSNARKKPECRNDE